MKEDADPAAEAERGPISWMVRHRVAPNLLMIFLIGGGLLVSLRMKKEVFPTFDMDMVFVRMAYPGASPEEVEQGIVLVIEEAVRGVEGVKEITSRASEGSATVTAELERGVDGRKVQQEIQQEIDRIRTFPRDAEEPQVSLMGHRREVLDIQVYGDADEWAVREAAEQVRDRLLQTGKITQVELRGIRNFEVRVEISRETLRAYGMTLGDIADAIEANALELPGGGVKTASGEILLRFAERKDWARQFAEIPVVTSENGTVVRLRDVAEVRDTFKIPKIGMVAGCYVQNGKITRGNKVRVVRDGIVAYDGVISSLKRFKDDVREVETGFECGLSLENFNDIKVGDSIESYKIVEKKRQLN